MEPAAAPPGFVLSALAPRAKATKRNNLASAVTSAATRGFDAAPWWSPSAALAPTRTARRAASLPPRRATPLPRGNIFPGRRAALYHIPRCFVPHLDGGGAWCPARSDEIELLQDLVSRSSFAFSFTPMWFAELFATYGI
jgi:hypothetical protein